MHFKKEDVPKDNKFKILIGILCSVLCISMFFNFKSPYISSSKTEHLGKLTYTLPVDTQYASKSEWTYSDFVCDTMGIHFPGKDGSMCFDGKTGKILEKGYIDMSSLSELTVEYDMGDTELNKDNTRSWTGDAGTKPKCIERITIETDEGPADKNEWTAGTYWKAFVTVDKTNYIVTVRSMHDADLSYIGEGVISSFQVDPKMKDEYIKE